MELLEENKVTDGKDKSPRDEPIPDIDVNQLLQNREPQNLTHPKPDLPRLEVGENANKPKDEFEPVVHHRLPGGKDRFRFYRNDQDKTMEHETLYNPKGDGVATWYREDGSITHKQFFNWRIDAYLKEGHFGYLREMRTDFSKIEEYDASGKVRTHSYIFDAQGNLSKLRSYNERGGLKSIDEFRPDGTLQSKTDYSKHTPRRTRYSQEDDIRLKIDPYIIRKPFLTEKDEVVPRF